MIILGYCILYGITLMLSYNKFHRIVNVVSVFSGIWCLFGSLSCLGLYGVRTPGFLVHIYAWIFVGIVDFIFLLFSTRHHIDINDNAYEAIRYNSRAKNLQIVSCVLIIPLALKVVASFVGSGSLATIREMYFSGTNFTSMYQDLLFRIVPMAFLDALIIYFVFYSFETRKYKYLVYALLDTLFVTVMNGGRYAFMMLLYSILILWVTGEINVSKENRFQKYKKKIQKIAIVIVIAMVVVTINRGQKIIENILLYFSGSLSYLDYIIEHPSQFALNQPLHGYLTFAAFIEPIVLLLKVLGLTTMKVPSYEFNIYCQKYYNIGTGSKYILINANTSVIYYFLRDFGTIGVVIGAIFMGGLLVKAYNKWQCGNRFWGLIFIYLGNVAFNSIMTYQLIGPTPFFIIIAFYTLAQKKVKIKFTKRGEINE